MTARWNLHPGTIGWGERARLAFRHPPRLVLFDGALEDPAADVPFGGIRSTTWSGKSFPFDDFRAPSEESLAAPGRRLSLQPLTSGQVPRWRAGMQ